MDKIDWKRKLTSRKLWLAVASFVSMLIIALGGTESESTQVAALIMAGSTVIGYIIGEGLADSGDVFSTTVVKQDDKSYLEKEDDGR